MTVEKMEFGTDVARLLDIVANALYSNRDVFLREIISNSADACDKLRYEAISKPELLEDDSDFCIRILKDAPTRMLTILDNGIGMDEADLRDNLGTIARSGTRSMMERVSESSGDKDSLSLIGQFGVGFYATFMVAEKVEVVTRKAGTDTVWHWVSDGRTGYEVREATTEEASVLKGGRGTAVMAQLKYDSTDYLLLEKIEQVIRTWSDHINIPVFLGYPGDYKDEVGNELPEGEEQPVNSVTALWTRPKNDITDEQYKEFYLGITHGMAFDTPMTHIHWRAEGKIEYTGLIYLPSMRSHDLFDPARKHSVRLYVKRVFITDDCEGLVYPWLRFIRGIIDSEDLPLNISREMLQRNAVIDKIRHNLAKKVLGELDKLAKNDLPALLSFWGQFGMVLKEGLYDAHEHRDDIFKVARFFSTNGEQSYTTLDEYIERMKDGQDEIYYITAQDYDSAKNSPQLEGFKARGVEVLYFTDTIDDFWLQIVDDFKGKKFQSVTKGDIDLERFDDNSMDKSVDKSDQESEETNAAIDALRIRMQDVLSEDVADVRLSKRLTDSPVCLVADEKGVDMQMERVMKIQQQYEGETKRHLEINSKHPLILKLASLAENENNEEEIKDATYLLYDQAMIIQGDSIKDPTAFARRMANFMRKGLVA